MFTKELKPSLRSLGITSADLPHQATKLISSIRGKGQTCRHVGEEDTKIASRGHMKQVSDDRLLPGVDDQHIWIPSSTGVFSTKSAYRCFFVGAIDFEPWQEIWKTWAPPPCKFFIWLAVLNHCWTADRLARRGLQHPEHCPLCDQEEETVQHLLM